MGVVRTGERLRDSFQMEDPQCVRPRPDLVPQPQDPVLTCFPRPRVLRVDSPRTWLAGRFYTVNCRFVFRV